ncbi:MAG: hypothetical protein J6J42_04115 [Lachnospiraceae bacterium]|nr:hypothetical protein [Lachnospiraceae bacterium]
MKQEGTDKGRKRFVRYDEGAELYSMSKGSFMKLAKEAHAVYKIKNIVLVSTELFENYLEAFRE